MIRRWLDSAISELRLPEIIAERCVHAHAEVASCRACLDACPHEAWVIDDDALGIDSSLCDGCGLCSAACPQAAIVSDGEPAVMRYKESMVALARCEQTDGEVEQLPSDRKISCIHSLGFRDLARMAAEDVFALYFYTGDCDHCQRGEALRLEQRLLQINYLLNASERPVVSLYRLNQRQWSNLLSSLQSAEQGKKSTRRLFLRQGLAQMATQLLPDLQLSDHERGAIQTPTQILSIDKQKSRALHSPAIDSRLCDGCDACVRLCPQSAIQLMIDDQLAQYTINSHGCTGCRLCVDICENRALSLQSPSVSGGTTTLLLYSARCRICGVPFHRPAIQDVESNLCHVCRKVNHKRNLFQVLP